MTIDKLINVCVLVGSQRKAPLNGMMANALMSLAAIFNEARNRRDPATAVFNQDLETASPPADGGALRHRVMAADAVLCVTPEYNRSVPAVLKNALDVGSRPYGSSVWDRKPGAGVSSSPGAVRALRPHQHQRPDA